VSQLLALPSSCRLLGLWVAYHSPSVCLISIIRLVSIRQLDFSDVTWQFSRVAYWGAVEVNLAIIAACLTTLKPLLVRTFPNLLGSSLNAYGPSSNMMRRGGTTLRSQRGGDLA